MTFSIQSYFVRILNQRMEALVLSYLGLITLQTRTKLNKSLKTSLIVVKYKYCLKIRPDQLTTKRLLCKMQIQQIQSCLFNYVHVTHKSFETFAKFLGQPLFKKICFRKSNLVCKKGHCFALHFQLQMTGQHVDHLKISEGLEQDGQFCNQFYLQQTRKSLANVGPKGELTRTPSTFLQSFPLKIRYDSFVARDKSSLKSIFDNTRPRIPFLPYPGSIHLQTRARLKKSLKTSLIVVKCKQCLKI